MVCNSILSPFPLSQLNFVVNNHALHTAIIHFAFTQTKTTLNQEEALVR
jgi:hypothetical protein